MGTTGMELLLETISVSYFTVVMPQVRPEIEINQPSQIDRWMSTDQDWGTIHLGSHVSDYFLEYVSILNYPFNAESQFLIMIYINIKK